MIWPYLLTILAYFIGTIPNSVYVAKLAGHDIYTEGSKNPGASNVARIAGWKWGMLAMLLDALKGFIPVLLGLLFLDNFVSVEQTRILSYLIATAAIFGHVVPLGRKGGKGIATAGGATIALFPIAGAVLLLVWAITMKFIKLPVVSSLLVSGLLTLWVAIFNQYLWEFFVVLALFSVIVYRHIPNIKRLVDGDETKVDKRNIDSKD